MWRGKDQTLPNVSHLLEFGFVSLIHALFFFLNPHHLLYLGMFYLLNYLGSMGIAFS